MPLPLLPLIGAGAALLGQGINAASTTAANRAAQRFQMTMYNRQRSDALADWNRQNEYNSPMQQMLRFKEAGLNPNLIYGQSAQAPAVRSASVGNYKPDAPQFDIGGVISQFVDLQLQTNQISLQEKLLDLREKELEMKDTASKIQGLDYEAKSALQETNIELGKENLRNMQMRTVTGWNEDNRNWTRIQNQEQLTTQQLRESEARIKQIGQAILSSQQSIEESEMRIRKMAVDMEFTHRQTQHTILAARNLMRTGDLLQFDVDLQKSGLKASWIEKAGGVVLDILGTTAEKRLGLRKR